MLRIKFSYLDLSDINNPNNGIYYFATEALDYNNIYWESRIVEPFEIERFFEIESDTTNRIRTVSVQLDNSDKFFNRFISDTTTLLNNLMTLYYDDGNGVTKSFTGNIQSIDSFGSTVSVTVRELGYEYLENTFPDAQIAYDYYSDSGINDSWNCIPIHFGTVNRIPLSWVNSFMSEYMIGSGPILSVDKVYIDDEVIYDVTDPDIHYKYDDDAKEIHVRIFKGRGYDADGQREYVDDEYHYEDETPITSGGNLYRHTSNWGGFAYIQLFSVNDDGFETPAYPYNKDGGIGQVYVDIRGIVDVIQVPGGYDYGTAMVRNPAKIIKMMFCNREFVSEAPCAIGWGYNESNCDFEQAIQDCERFEFVIDGSFDTKQVFSEALKQILYCCRGYIIEENEKITLHIDKGRDGSNVTQFDEEGIYGYDCTLENWTDDDVDDHINRVRLNYDWSQEFNRYLKKPDANHESPDTTDEHDYDQYLQDVIDTAKVQKWNPEELEFKMVSDCNTAHRLAVYYLRKKSRQHIKSSLTCPNSAAMDLDAGDIIMVRSKQFGWINPYDEATGKLFQITKISKGQDLTSINFCEYSDSVFEHDTTVFTSMPRESGVENKLSAKTPLNVTVTTSYKEVAQSYVCEINGNIEFDPSGHKQYSIIKYCDCGTTPPSGNYVYNWVTYANIDGSEFTINGVNHGHYYVISVATRNNYDVSEPFLTMAVLVPGDTVAPGIPSAELSVYLKTINFNITLADYPSDLCGFEIRRASDPEAESGDYTQIGICYAQNGIGTFVDDKVPAYDTQYYYKVRAFDWWGNYSEYSERYAATCPKVQVADCVYDWIVSNIFETAVNVGMDVDGVRFAETGIQGWRGGQNLFNLSTVAQSTIGGWIIEYNKLTNEKIEINSNGMIRTSDYVSGHNGWSVNQEGDAEFNNVKVRGIVKTAVFEKDRISAVGGYELIRPATVSTVTGSGEFVSFEYLVSESAYTVEQATIQHEYVMADLNALMDTENTLEPYDSDMTYDEYRDIEYEAAELAAELMGYTISDRGNTVYVASHEDFHVDDIVRIKNGATNDVWARVASKGSNAYRGNYINFETASGTWFDPEAGQSIVNYGQAGSGGILLDGNAPRIDLYTHDGEPWNGVDTCMRLGNLNGINGNYTDKHGFFVGNPDTSDENRSYMQYDEESKRLVIRGIVDILGGQAHTAIQNATNTANQANNTANQANTIAQEAMQQATGSVASADIYYAVSTSPTSITGREWSTESPTWEYNKYIWTKTVYRDKNGIEISESSPVCISGTKGPAGESGIEVVGINELYYVSDLSSTPDKPNPESAPIIETRLVYNTWTKNCPPYDNNRGYKYFFTCVEIQYSDDSYTYSDVTSQKAIETANTLGYGIIEDLFNGTHEYVTEIAGGIIRTGTITSRELTTGELITQVGQINNGIFNSLLLSSDGYASSFARYGYCTTTASNNEKTVTIENFPSKYFDGMSIGIKFQYKHTYQSSGYVTLNINGIGAKEIYAGGNRLADPYNWDANDTVNFIYDGTNQRWNMMSATVFSRVFESSQDISSIKTALGGSSFPKLTLITNAGIYTGTLVADQIKTGYLSADRIQGGTINIGKFDTATQTKVNNGNTALTKSNGIINDLNNGTKNYIAQINGNLLVNGSVKTDAIATDGIKSKTCEGGGDGKFTTKGIWFGLTGQGFISAVNFYIKSNGQAVFKGDISGSTGTFKGDISGATGTFNGGIKATSGTNVFTFNSSGLILKNGSTNKFVVDMNGNITANGKLVSSNAEITGKINATSGTFNSVTISSGTLNGINISSLVALSQPTIWQESIYGGDYHGTVKAIGAYEQLMKFSDKTQHEILIVSGPYDYITGAGYVGGVVKVTTQGIYETETFGMTGICASISVTTISFNGQDNNSARLYPLDSSHQHTSNSFWVYVPPNCLALIDIWAKGK